VSVTRADPLSSPGAKVALWWRIASLYLRVLRAMGREAIPEVARRMRAAGGAVPEVRPERLGRIVARVLAIGPWRARCLHTSFVLYAMLHARGEDAVLVIGLPERPSSKDAHAWVELAGRDVGPPPGRGTHVELARYA
jgi:Transglutaminase-like superfamily